MGPLIGRYSVTVGPIWLTNELIQAQIHMYRLVKSDFENLDYFLSYRVNRQTDRRTDFFSHTPSKHRNTLIGR